MPRVTRVLLVAAAALLLARGASADVTAFVGVNPTPSNRSLVGFAGGAGFLVVGFEFEYMRVKQDLQEGAPALKTGMANVYAQNPVPISGMQFYGITGIGVYGERLEQESGATIHSATNIATDVGGGVKISLAGPLKLRLDYRVFVLRGTPLYTKPQRFYAGATLAF